MASFTAENATLILIDHQIGKMQLVRTGEGDSVKRMALVLARAARILDLPTIFTSNLESAAHGPLLPELADAHPKANQTRIARVGRVNPWHDPQFKAAIVSASRPNLVMAGITADASLLLAAVAASQDGYKVQAVMDASGSPFALSEELARDRMTKAGVTLTTTHTLITELAQDWNTPQGRELSELLFTQVLPPIRRYRRQPLVKRYGGRGRAEAGD